jgi:tRNA1Val (adenine37-N6)-methyltransferase
MNARGPNTEDALFGGKVVLFQPARGYRVNIDSLLLAHFARGRRSAQLAVDLGAGVGALSLALHYLGAARRVVLVERDPELCKLAWQNLNANAIDGVVEPVDLVESRLPSAYAAAADLVVANPPFFEARSGRARNSSRQRSARSGSLLPFLRAAARALSGASARALFVYPASSLQALLARASELSLVAKRIRCVHARQGAPARLTLVELRRAKPGGLVIEAPLYEWTAAGVRSPEVEALISARADDQR